VIYRSKLPFHSLLIEKCPMKSFHFFVKCLLFCLVQLTIELSHSVYLYRKLITIDQVRNSNINKQIFNKSFQWTCGHDGFPIFRAPSTFFFCLSSVLQIRKQLNSNVKWIGALCQNVGLFLGKGGSVSKKPSTQ